jgi:hypothetical protein
MRFLCLPSAGKLAEIAVLSGRGLNRRLDHRDGVSERLRHPVAPPIMWHQDRPEPEHIIEPTAIGDAVRVDEPGAIINLETDAT